MTSTAEPTPSPLRAWLDAHLTPEQRADVDRLWDQWEATDRPILDAIEDSVATLPTFTIDLNRAGRQRIADAVLAGLREHGYAVVPAATAADQDPTGCPHHSDPRACTLAQDAERYTDGTWNPAVIDGLLANLDGLDKAHRQPGDRCRSATGDHLRALRAEVVRLRADAETPNVDLDAITRDAAVRVLRFAARQLRCRHAYCAHPITSASQHPDEAAWLDQLADEIEQRRREIPPATVEH